MAECALHLYLWNICDPELESDVVGDAEVDVLSATQIWRVGFHIENYASELSPPQREITAVSSVSIQ